MNHDVETHRSSSNLQPGGWIEQLEPDARVQSDDDTLAPDSSIASWGPVFEDCADRAGRSIKMTRTMRESIEKAGFINVQDHLFKTPIGSWPKEKTLKEAGRVNWVHWTAGLEGYATFLLTKFGKCNKTQRVETSMAPLTYVSSI